MAPAAKPTEFHQKLLLWKHIVTAAKKATAKEEKITNIQLRNFTVLYCPRRPQAAAVVTCGAGIHATKGTRVLV